MKCYLHKDSFRTNFFGKFSVTISVIDSWSKMQGQMDEIALKGLRTTKTKWLLIKSY